MILAVPLLLSFVVIKIVSGDTGAVVLIVVAPVLAGAGIWMAGYTTTITFNAESMVVTRGYIPLSLWWLRTKCVSRETARTVNVTCHPQITDMTEYWVEVVTASSRKLTLFKWDSAGEANDLMKRIKRWSGPEY